jgi:hypothetical protein
MSEGGKADIQCMSVIICCLTLDLLNTSFIVIYIYIQMYIYIYIYLYKLILESHVILYVF